MSLTNLGGMLYHEGLIDDDDLHTIKDSCGSASSAFAKAILTVGLLDEDELAHFLSIHTHHRIAAKDLMLDRDPDLGSVLPDHLMAELEVFPLRKQGRFLTVAMLDPTDKDVIHQIEFFTGYRVKPVIATQSHLYKALKQTLSQFEPHTSPLEEFLHHHIEGTLRHLKISMTPPGRMPMAPSATTPQSSSPGGRAGASHAAPPPVAEDLEVPEDTADLIADLSVDLTADLAGDIPMEMEATPSPVPAADIAAEPATGFSDLSEEPDELTAIADAEPTAQAQDPGNILDLDEPVTEESAAPAVPADDPIDDILGGLDNAFEAPAAEAGSAETLLSATPAADVGGLDDILDAPMDTSPLIPKESETASVSDDIGIDIDVSAELGSGIAEGGLDEPGTIVPGDDLGADLTADVTIAEAEPSDDGDLFGDVLASEEAAAPAPTADKVAPPPVSAATADPATVMSESEGTIDDDDAWLVDTMSGLNRLQVALSLAPSREKALNETAKALSRAGLVAGALFAQTPQGLSAWGDWSSDDSQTTTGHEFSAGVPAAALASLVAKIPEGRWTPVDPAADATLQKAFASWATPDANMRALRTAGQKPLVCISMWDARGSANDVLLEMTADLLRRASPLGS